MPVKTPSKKRTYKSAPGARFSNKEAQEIGRQLEGLELSGPVTPDRVVQDASDPHSPLHKHFTWDDTAAARMFRKEEARSILQHLIITVEIEEKVVETRGWHNVVVIDEDNVPSRQYASVSTIEDSYDLREQVVKKAMLELQSWTKKYSIYQELFGVSEAILKAIDLMPSAARETVATSNV